MVYLLFDLIAQNPHAERSVEFSVLLPYVLPTLSPPISRLHGHSMFDNNQINSNQITLAHL
jgi:hypothetical protein